MAQASDIIEQLGGAAKISRETGFPLTTIAGWGASNFIPEWRRADLLALAGREKVSLSPTEFPTTDQRRKRATSAPRPDTAKAAEAQ